MGTKRRGGSDRGSHFCNCLEVGFGQLIFLGAPDGGDRTSRTLRTRGVWGQSDSHAAPHAQQNKQ